MHHSIDKRLDQKTIQARSNPSNYIFQATTHPTKGGGAKVTIPTYTTQSLVRLEIVHQIDREVGYYRVQKGKGKRKINST